MAKMSDMAPGGRLHCASPEHPENMSRDTMYFLELQGEMFCFGCKLCTEIKRSLQLHVIARDRGGIHIYQNTRKAENIDRDKKGNITSFR